MKIFFLQMKAIQSRFFKTIYNYLVYVPIKLIGDTSTLYCHACLQFYAGHEVYAKYQKKTCITLSLP